MKVDTSLLMKIGIPIGLAIAAAIFQSMAIRGVVQTDSFLVVTRDLIPGDVIRAKDVRTVEVSKKYIPPGAILEKDSAIAVGSPVIRKVKSEHLVLRGDLLIGRRTLSIDANETPVAFDVDDSVIRSNNFYVGQDVYLLFFNDGESVTLGDVTYPANRDIEIGPLRVVSIGSAIAPFSEAPEERVRQIAVAVQQKTKEKSLLLAAQKRGSEIEMRGIYSRPSE